MRVLVCEDETIIRLDICQLLETAGHAVVGEARDGAEAVRLAAELTPDIILMDVRMPELDGVEAARQILAARQVPIVMVTAFAERDIVQQASEAGAFGYLVKPFRQDDVLAAITTAAGAQRRARRGPPGGEVADRGARDAQGGRARQGHAHDGREHHRARRLRTHALRLATHGPAHAGDRRSAAGDPLRPEVIRRHVILILGLALTALAGFLHTALSDTAGTIAAAFPLLLVAPIVAKGTDALRGRLSTSVVGIVQSGFGNIAELAITILALRANLPEVVKLAIVGSLLGNAVLLGGLAGLIPLVRGGFGATLRFERRLFSGITTLSLIAFLPDGDPERPERPARHRRSRGHLARGRHRADDRRRRLHPHRAARRPMHPASTRRSRATCRSAPASSTSASAA